MSGVIRVLHRLLLVLFIGIFAVNLLPTFSTTIANKYELTNDKISNLLAALDIIIATILTVYGLVDQKIAEKKCIYKFSTAEDNLSLHNYIRFPSKTKNVYNYLYNRESKDIEEPYHGMEVILEKNPICGIGLPLYMQVLTGLDGSSINFSSVRIYAKDGKTINIKGKKKKGIEIKQPIKNEDKYLVRIQLLCNRDMEKRLLNSRVYLSFILTLKDDRDCEYKKYILLESQNVMGESKVLNVIEKNSWGSYIIDVLKLEMEYIFR